MITLFPLISRTRGVECLRHIRAPEELRLSRSFGHAWAWVEFLFSYHNYLPTQNQPGLKDLSTILLRVFRNFIRTPDTTELVMTHLWRAGKAHVRKDWTTCVFIQQDSYTTSYSADIYLDEYIEGAGDSAEDLASLVVCHFDCAHGQDHKYLLPAIRFTRKITPDDDTFVSALLSRGLPKVITRALAFLAATGPDGTSQLNGHTPGIYAPRSGGLLRAFILCTKHLRSEMEIVPLKLWLEDILPSATVFHSVPGHLQAAFQDVHSIAVPENIASPEIRGLWNIFAALLEQRLQLKAHFDALLLGTVPIGAMVATATYVRSCEAAAMIIPARAPRRRLCPPQIGHIPRADRDIIPNVYRSYTRTESDYVLFIMITYPGGIPAVKSIRAAHVQGKLRSAHYRQRVVESAGRTELHGICVCAAGVELKQLFPMSSKDSHVHDGLRGIANRLTNESLAIEELDAEARDLATLDVRTIPSVGLSARQAGIETWVA
ncbi:hypothetical protein FB451DRAFT_1167618 [Mycena latifolia]|nr:hypothetical protein FB451DRAFT_1167618 [Mycena latifolia]